MARVTFVKSTKNRAESVVERIVRRQSCDGKNDKHCANNYFVSFGVFHFSIFKNRDKTVTLKRKTLENNTV